MSYSAVLDGLREPHQLSDDDFEEEILAKGVWKTLWNVQLAWGLERARLLREIDRLQNENAHLGQRTAELSVEVGELRHPTPAGMKKR